MEKEYNYYDYLRYELFEILIPRMLYKGTRRENNKFFQLLLQEKKKLVHDMYQTLCEDDGLPYPYEQEDFEVEIFSRGNINVLQILLPPNNPDISNILRVYLLFTKCTDKGLIKKYFVIKKFDNGRIFNLHITSDIEGVLGGELTAHIGDMQYEYWLLVRDYIRTIVQDMRTEKKGGKCRKKDLIQDKRKKEHCGMEVTEEQFEEFLRRLQENEPEE